MAHDLQRRDLKDESAELGDRLVQVTDLTVEYEVQTDRHHSTLRSRFARGQHAREIQRVVALRDVSMEVKQGEVVGVIGSNGSGKSTLVRTIAGLHPPTEGQVLVGAHPTLLGVGAILQPKLSGARNVMLGCLALGMTKAEANERFEDIVDFSGIREAIDRPMRTYSSGMRARLHFSIATSVDPQILLIDEVLAVGDRDFKRRSLDRLGRLRDRAGGVVMVTHSLRQMRKIASRAIWLQNGRILEEGDPKSVVKAYRRWSEDPSS